MSTVMGLDVSTRFGLAVGDGTDAVCHLLHYPPMDVRAYRWQQYADEVAVFIRDTKPALAVIEGYSFGSPNGAAFLGELGGVIRATLYQQRVPTVEVSPSTLKKFVTGKGNSKKQEMLLHIYKRWDREFKDDNKADAFGLCMVGHALLGRLPTTMVMESALDKVRESNSHVLSSVQA